MILKMLKGTAQGTVKCVPDALGNKLIKLGFAELTSAQEKPKVIKTNKKK